MNFLLIYKFFQVLGEKKGPKAQRGVQRTEGFSKQSLASEKTKNLSVLDRLFSKEELVDDTKAVKAHHRELGNRIAKQRASSGTATKGKPSGAKKRARSAGRSSASGGQAHKFKRSEKGNKRR